MCHRASNVERNTNELFCAIFNLQSSTELKTFFYKYFFFHFNIGKWCRWKELDYFYGISKEDCEKKKTKHSFKRTKFIYRSTFNSPLHSSCCTYEFYATETDVNDRKTYTGTVFTVRRSEKWIQILALCLTTCGLYFFVTLLQNVHVRFKCKHILGCVASHFNCIFNQPYSLLTKVNISLSLKM